MRRGMRSKAMLRVMAAACVAAAIGAMAVRAQTPKASDAARIEQIEKNTALIEQGGGKPPIQLPLTELMEKYRVPGLSIAVIENFQIAWVRCYGVIEAGSSQPVTPRTLFQAGSISKPVAATAALWMVEQGKLSLDTNVNDTLKSWKVPDNEFTRTEKVTLRRLMSHTGGLTVHGFPGYDVDDKLPTIVEVLNGEKPANTAPVRVDFVPGTKFRYSGGGVTIEQLMMTEVSGKKFPDLMREVVLDKIGMTDSSYQQPLLRERSAMTAGGTDGAGKLIHGRWHIYPEMAAAGLWTTPTDLAKFAIEIANSRNGKSNKILSEKMATQMLTPTMDARVGLGFFMDKKVPAQFGHDGADEGFQALLSMNYQTGNGFAIMANSDFGIATASWLARAVAREYGWTYAAEENWVEDLYLLAELRGAQAALARYEEKTASMEPEARERSLNGFGYLLLQGGMTQQAIQVFQKNVENFPKSSNVYDSLGEAYMAAGMKQKAIENYEKSLELNPKNENAKEKLKQLRSN